MKPWREAPFLVLGMQPTSSFILVKNSCMLKQVVFNVLKNPNPLKDDEASALLDAAVLVLALFWGSSML